MNPKHNNFMSHRCERPEGFAVRKYSGNEWMVNLGWSVWFNSYDYDWDVDTFELGASHIRFCPWCGKELK